jgi:hypothetical protein
VQSVMTRDVGQFAARAEGFLAARVERNVLATVLLDAPRRHSVASRPLFAYGTDEGGRLAAAALRTPPWPLLVSELDEAWAGALMDCWLTVDSDVPGVNAAAASARATAAERELLIAWERAFAREAGIGQGDRAPQVVEVRLARGGQFVWDDQGAVSTLAPRPRSQARYASAPSTRHPLAGAVATPPPPSPPAPAARWAPARAGACCSPISPTRPPTRSTPRSASADAESGRSTSS